MKNNFYRLLLIPSLYGFGSWILLLILLIVGPLQVTVKTTAIAIYIYVIICFGMSFIISYLSQTKKNLANIYLRRAPSSYERWLFYFSTIVGIFGLQLYVKDFAEVVGGYFQFFIIFIESPKQIRSIAEYQSSLGFQLSYFSWISICYCVIEILDKKTACQKRKQIFLWLLLIAQILLNLLFIDRTRPVILMVTIGLIYLFNNKDELKKPYLKLTYFGIFPFVFFIVFALLTDKYNHDEGVLNDMLSYILGGFGYFSAMLDLKTPDYLFDRTFYPVAKVVQLFDESININSQIPEFYAVPFQTNAGTFLEPLYADGGILLVIIGVPLIIALVDYMAAKALKMRSYMGLIFWSHMIVIQVFSFFVPKYNSTHIYLFSLILLASHILNRRTR